MRPWNTCKRSWHVAMSVFHYTVTRISLLTTCRVRAVVGGLGTAVVVEDYPDYPRGPCVLLLESDGDGQPIHVVWGLPAGQGSPAVLMTAYRPDPEKWDETWRRRRT